MKESFMDNLGKMTIAEYFQLPNINITLSQPDERTFIYTFKYSNINSFKFRYDLPLELNSMILTYLYEYSIIEYKMYIPDDYPFKPPIWSCENIITNKYNSIQSNHLFAVIFQNYRYSMDWSPMISIEKDILNMIDSIEITKHYGNKNTIST